MVLTKRQKEILDFIRSYMSEEGCAPSYDDIASRFGFSSKGTVYRHVHTLEKKGHIFTNKNKSRSIQLTPEEDATFSVPVIGTISRKNGLVRYKIPDHMSLPGHFEAGNDDRILMVADNSYREEYVLKRDLLVLSSSFDRDTSFYCLAQVDKKEYMVKYYTLENNIIRLNSTNIDLLPLFYEPNRIKIIGRITAVIREF